MEQETKLKIAKFLDILKIAKKKLRALICIALIAAILSSGLFILKAAIFGTYGAEVTFYIAPASNAYSLLSLLESDSFFEKLLLDENGLPPRDKCDPEEYDAALAAVIASREARQAKYEAVKKYDSLPFEFAKIEKTYDILQREYDEAYGLLNMYKTAYENTVDDENHNERLAEYEKRVDDAADAKNEYKNNVYTPAVIAKLEAEEAVQKTTELVKETQKEEEKHLNIVLAKWRSQKETKTAISKLAKAINFSYDTRQIKEGTTSAEVYDTPFIKATVQLRFDKEFADQIVENIKSYTPDFVIKNMEKWTGTVEAECTLISTFSETKNLELLYLSNNLPPFAVVCVLLSCGVGFLIFVCKEKKFSLDYFKKNTEKA